MLDVMGDGVDDWAGDEKEGSIEAVEGNICEKPAIPEREHEQHDQYAVQNNELRGQRERHRPNEK